MIWVLGPLGLVGKWPEDEGELESLSLLTVQVSFELQAMFPTSPTEIVGHLKCGTSNVS